MEDNRYKEYLVGGAVRDEILGLKSKDKDYVFVFDDVSKLPDIDAAFCEMEACIKAKGKIYLSTPQCLTIRYQDFQTGEFKDVVLARKELGYREGTREPIVVPGTLLDDLQRRDFTVNAIAKDANGVLYDPFGGRRDIINKVLRTPIAGQITFADDPLRLLRAIRLAVTKGFGIHRDIIDILHNFDYENKFHVVSEDRIREELHKAFKHNTLETLEHLRKYYSLQQYIFTRTKIWLKPTTEL